MLLSEGLIRTDAVSDPQLRITLQERQDAREKLDEIERPIVVLYPDSGMQIKQWSTGSFVQLGRELQQRYGASIVVPIESDSTQVIEIVTAIGGTAQIWQPGTLRELAAMMMRASHVLPHWQQLGHL